MANGIAKTNPYNQRRECAHGDYAHNGNAGAAGPPAKRRSAARCVATRRPRRVIDRDLRAGLNQSPTPGWGGAPIVYSGAPASASAGAGFGLGGADPRGCAPARVAYFNTRGPLGLPLNAKTRTPAALPLNVEARRRGASPHGSSLNATGASNQRRERCAGMEATGIPYPQNTILGRRRRWGAADAPRPRATTIMPAQQRRGHATHTQTQPFDSIPACAGISLRVKEKRDA